MQIPQILTPRKSTFSHSYYLLSKYNSLGSMSAFERIRLDLSQEMLSKTSPRNRSEIKRAEASSVGKSRVERKGSGGEAREPAELQYEQKLVERRLRENDLKYQKLLIMEAQLDLLLTEEEIERKVIQKAATLTRNKTEHMKVAKKRMLDQISQKHKELNLFYEFLGYLKHPNKPLNRNIRVEREQSHLDLFNQTVTLFTQEAHDYEGILKEKQQQLSIVRQDLLTAKQLLERDREARAKVLAETETAKLRNMLGRLELKKLSLTTQCIRAESMQLQSAILNQEKELEECEKLRHLIALHTQSAHAITTAIGQWAKQQCEEAAALKKSIPQLNQALSDLRRAKSKHLFRFEAQSKRIRMLNEKIRRLVQAPDEPNQSTQ